MLSQPNQQEREVLERLATGSDGKTLCEFFQKVVNQLIDIRNIPDMNVEIEKKARTLAVSILEENIINRLKNLNGDMTAPDEDQYE